MKRYLIPIFAIVVIGGVTYFWTSRLSARRAMVKARHAHLDSLRTVQSKRFTVATIDTIMLPARDSMLKPSPSDTELKLSDVWAIKHLDAMPDSVRPQNFADSSVKYELDMDHEGEEGAIFEGVFFGDKVVAGFDTVASKLEQRNYWFIKNTVMTMLLRHLKNTVNTDEFSRCPSGYFFATNGQEQNRYADQAHSKSEQLWDSGTVYFDVGCGDTAMCDFRFNYAKRFVEMKDINSSRFQSLREYEVAKFSQYADLRRPEH